MPKTVYPTSNREDTDRSDDVRRHSFEAKAENSDYFAEIVMVDVVP